MIGFLSIFFFVGETNKTDTKLSAYVFLNNAEITIKTCLFKCGQCFSDFSQCDEGL